MAVPPASLTDSRNGVGTLTIAGSDYSYQVANVRLTPDVSEEDGTATLAEPKPAPLATITWSLAGTVVQDFELGAASFLNYLMDHALEEVLFEWVPQTVDTPELIYSGTCQLRPAEIGGDAAVQLTSDFELPVIGEPVRADPAPAAASRTSKGSSSSSSGSE